MSAECLHDDIETLRAANGGPSRMWACRACRRRLYVACPICVDVGHRGAHVDRVADERARIVREAHKHEKLPSGSHHYDRERMAYNEGIADILRIIEGEEP